MQKYDRGRCPVGAVAETSSYGVAGQIYRNRGHLASTWIQRAESIRSGGMEVISSDVPETPIDFENDIQRIAVGIPSNPTKASFTGGRSGPGTTLNPKERHGG